MLTIQLENSINVVDGKGGFVDVALINIPQCTMLNYSHYIAIKEVVTPSLFKLADMVTTPDDEVATNDEPTDEDLKLKLDIFAVAGTMGEIKDVVNKYLVKFAKWDDEYAVKPNDLNKLTISEYTNLLERVSYFLYNV